MNTNYTVAIKITTEQDASKVLPSVRAEYDKLGQSAKAAAAETVKHSQSLDQLQSRANATAEAWRRQEALQSKTAEATAFHGKEVQNLINKYDPLGAKVRLVEADLAKFRKTMGDSVRPEVMATFARMEDQLVAAKTAALAAGDGMARGMERGMFATAQARRELIVLGREAMTGDFARMPGTMMVLASRSNVSATALLGMGGAFAVATAGAAAFAVAADRGHAEMRAMDNALQTTSGYAGMTRGQMVQLAEEMTRTSALTIGQSKQVVTELVASGRIGAQSLGTVAKLAGDYAAATGQDIDQVAPKLVQLFESPAKAAETLNQQMHFLAVAQIEHIRALERDGQLSEAQLYLAQQLTDHLPKQTENLGYLERAWTSLKKGASAAWDAMLGVGRTQTLEERLAEAQQAVLDAGRRGNNIAAKAAAAEFARIKTEMDRRQGDASGKGQDAAFNEQAQALDKLANSYKSVGMQMADKRADAARLNAAMKELRERGEEGSDTYKKYASALGEANRQISEMGKKDQAQDKLSSAITALQFEQAQLGRTAEQQAYYNALKQSGISANSKYAPTILKNVQALEQAKAVQIAFDREFDSAIKQQEEMVKAYDKKDEAAQQQTQRMQQELDQLIAANEAYGLGKVGLADLTVARLDDALAAAKLTDANSKATAELEKQLDIAKKLVGEYRRGEALDASSKAAKQTEDDWKRAGQEIERSLTDALMRGFESGKDFGSNLVDALKNMFKTLVLRPIIQPIAQAGASMVLGAFGMPGAANASSGSGGMLGSASNVASLYNMGSGLAGGFSIGSQLGSLATFGTTAGNVVSGGMILEGSQTAAMIAAQGGAEFAGGTTLVAGTGMGSGIGATLAAIPGWGWAAMAALAILGSGALKQKPNEWEQVDINPDADLAGRIKATHGSSALLKTDSGLNLGATWKRTSGEQAKAALAAMSGIDATLYGLTGADMTGKLGGAYGYNKKGGGFLANGKAVGSMDEVMAQFTRDWVSAADTVSALNKDLVATVTGSAEEVLKKTVAIVSMTQADMDKLFGESITAEKFKAVARSGEGAGDAFARLAPIFATTSHAAKVMGATVEQMFGQSGLAGTAGRENLVKQAGGSDALNSLLGDYQNAYFTDAEKLKLATDSVAAAFEKAGKTMPATKAEYRATMEDMAKSGDLATESGAKLYAELLKLAPAFAQVQDAAAAARQSLIDNATAAVDAARGKLQTAYDAEAGALQSVIDKMGGFAKAIKQFRESLLLGDLSPLSPLAKYDEAQRQFDDVQRRAALGDESAIEQLQAVSQAYLEASREYNASNSQYVADFGRVQQALSSTESVATRHANIAGQQLAALNQQVAGLLDVKNATLSVADAIRDLQRALTAQGIAKQPDAAASPAAGGSRITSPAGVVQGVDPLRSGSIAAAAYNGGNITDASVAAAISQGLGYGYSPQQIAAAWNDSYGSIKTVSATDIVSFAQKNDIPGYATGGDHLGGLRLVGERGWELEATGPARYWNQEQLGRAVAGGDNKETVEELKAQTAELRTMVAALIDLHRELADGNQDNNERLLSVERRLLGIDGRLAA